MGSRRTAAEALEIFGRQLDDESAKSFMSSLACSAWAATISCSTATSPTIC